MELKLTSLILAMQSLLDMMDQMPMLKCKSVAFEIHHLISQIYMRKTAQSVARFGHGMAGQVSLPEELGLTPCFRRLILQFALIQPLLELVSIHGWNRTQQVTAKPQVVRQ